MYNMHIIYASIYIFIVCYKDQVTQVQRSSQLSAIREEDSVIGNSGM